MAAFKRRGRRYYEIEPVLPVTGPIGRLSARWTSRRAAEAVERALHELDVTGWSDLCRAVRERRIRVMELYDAKIRGEAALLALRERLEDVELAAVVREYRELVTDRRVREGLDQLLELAPLVAGEAAGLERVDSLMFGWLRQPANLTRLYARAMQTRRPNSVRRSLHRAVCELLTYRLGRGEMLRVMADVRKPGERDERTAMLTPDEIEAALRAADPEFRPVLGLAVTTGIDRGVMLALRVADYDERAGTLRVPDLKTAARPRTLVLRGEPILENAEYWLRLLVAGRRPAEPLVPLTAGQIRSRWAAVRRRIGRSDVRWKDLRGVFATWYLAAGATVRDCQYVLGHATITMSVRYERRLPGGRNRLALREQALRVGRLEHGGLRVEHGGA